MGEGGVRVSEARMKNRDLWDSLVWLLVGWGFLWGGYSLGMGPWNAPGPGFFPILIGSLLCLLAVVFFIQSVLGRERVQKQVPFWKEKTSWKKVSYSLLALIFYLLVLNGLGFITTTFLFLFFVFKFVGKKRWQSSLLVALLASAITFLVFKTALEVPLPRGIFKIG
jgi:putative tricarboxylic transport membrane protein